MTPTEDPISLTRGHYRITATAHGRTLASAVRTLWGWHLAYLGPDRRPEWHSYDTSRAATKGVYLAALTLLRRHP